MVLVNYSDSSDSEAESERPQRPALTVPPRQTTKKSIAKLVDASGKVVVNLPATAAVSPSDLISDEPPAKRARTGGGGGGGGLFGDFNALLPAPKNRNAIVAKASGLAKAPPPGVHLKTSAEPGFVRRVAREDDDDDDRNSDGESKDELHGRKRGLVVVTPGGGSVSGLVLPPPNNGVRPGTSSGIQSEGVTKVAGKPLSMKPLSVSQKPKKKTKASHEASAKVSNTESPGSAITATATTSVPRTKPTPVSAQPISLFSFSKPSEPDDSEQPDSAVGSTTYEPLIATSNAPYSGVDTFPIPPPPIDFQILDANQTTPAPGSLNSFASTLNLSAAERRELLGRQRGGRAGNASATTTELRVIDMEAEYDHNEALRASGTAVQAHVPVRAVQPGKHNARQLVNMVHNQREALEESFTRARNNKREAAGRYGW